MKSQNENEINPILVLLNELIPIALERNAYHQNNYRTQ